MTENKELKGLIKNIINDFDDLCGLAQEQQSKGLDLTTGCGEIEINGTIYQVQLQITPNPLMWVKENEIRRSRNANENHLN